MTNEQKRILEQKLWAIADELRGRMNADGFRDYMLGFIFYKYLSEKMIRYANAILKQDGIEYQDIDEDAQKGKDILKAIKENATDVGDLGFFLKPSELFHELARRGNAAQEDSDDKDSCSIEKGNDGFILGDLDKVLKGIELSTMGTASEEDFVNLFEDLDLKSIKLGKTEKQKNETVVKIFSHLDRINFELDNTDADVLGDAYEYLIGKFASGAGKKAGEFYTPQQVSKILAKLVTTGKTKLKSVYDPTCGSGSLLLRVAKEVKSVSNFYGQEMNVTTYNLARMNMILHDVHHTKFSIKQDDTLEHPQHLNMKFEAIVANPPFSANWSANPLHLNDDRFAQYGKLAPSSKADYAFIQHMVHHLDDNGQMAVVMPHGVLFRGAAEGHIRQYLIEDRNYLDAVIGLPANIFYGTSIPTCILVFKKCRENPKDILFIDASQEFEKGSNENILLDKNVEKIINTYKERKVIDKYSYVASLDEIKENDYNLNIPRYVDTFEEEEPVDIKAVAKDLKDLDIEMQKTNKIIAGFCKELGVDTPF